VRVLELDGSATQMGEVFGEACRREIAELYGIRLRNALAQAKSYGGRDACEADLLSLSHVSCRPTEAYDPEGFAELRGIARAAGLTLERVLALNGLTDFRDALAWSGELEAFGGCTWFVVPANRSATGQVLCGQTWDLGTDNQPFVVALHRRPLARPETWTVTTAGCLSLMGLNSAGIAIGTSNLRTTDARPGVPYLSLIHRALACASHDDAVAAITHAQRAGAHAYYVVDADGNASALECTALHAEVLPITTRAHVHTNHCQTDAHAQIEGDVPRDSSEARRRRMSELLAPGTPDRGLTLDDLRGFLADRKGGDLAICRDDFDGISTNAAIAMAPAEPSARACHGLPSTADWIDLQPAHVVPRTG
jgi:isopenicillin-N N-acyltransferase-like protein